MSDMERRLDDLEAHITHQDATIHDLNEVVLQQWNEIKALTEKIVRMEGKLQSVEEMGTGNEAPESPPPHY